MRTNATETRLFGEGVVSLSGAARISTTAGLRPDPAWIRTRLGRSARGRFELCHAGRWLSFDARLSPADEDARLPAQHLSQGTHHPPRGRTRARTGATGRIEIPYPRSRRPGPRRAHWSRGRCDV